jgi:ribonuclease R
VVGEFQVGRRGQYVVPHDDRIQQWIDIPDGMEMPPAGATVDRIGVMAPKVSSVEELVGMVVNVELLDYEQRVGRVIEILGHPDDFGVDVEVVIRKHHLPHQFPPEVVELAEGVPAAIGAGEWEGRRDFRGMEIVTIDGETARDFDDAVWVDKLANGNYALHVHIADVSHYVRPGSPIDGEALLRGTSVYFPDRPSGRSGGPGVPGGRDPQRGADDVHRRAQAVGGRCGAARAVPAVGGAVRADAGTGAGVEPQAGEARVDRFRPAGAGN